MRFILLAMLFCHIVDDYYLQRILASMKQKSWWESQPGYSLKYSKDYIMALCEHAFSWTFMIMLPIFIVRGFYVTLNLGIVFFINWLIHSITDNAKANLNKINLVQDQIIHIIQVCITFVLFVLGVI